jgi:ABC-type amino acid transport substrate-binding protein
MTPIQETQRPSPPKRKGPACNQVAILLDVVLSHKGVNGTVIGQVLDGLVDVVLELSVALVDGDKLGLDVEYVNNDFDTLVPGVASGAKYDVSIAAITDTPEREKEVTFSDSYYMDDQAIVTKVDNTDITAAP